jgi:hypothetical protein
VGKRLGKLKQQAAKFNRGVSSLMKSLRGATQQSVKFIRWLRNALRMRLAEEAAVASLDALLTSP